jgi:GNAT superfamily N-acetyltransferase
MKTEYVSLEKSQLSSDHDWWTIYHSCFPEEEREPKEVILRSIDQHGGKAFAVKIDNKTIGIATTQLLVDPGCIFLIYLALHPGYRGQGLGGGFLSFILQHGINQFKEKGIACNGLIWEVEKPDQKLSEKENSKRIRRIDFFKSLGGQLLDIRYIQPPVDGKNIMEMNLMYLSSVDQFSTNSISAKSLIHSIYFEKYYKVNNIDFAILIELFTQAG